MYIIHSRGIRNILKRGKFGHIKCLSRKHCFLFIDVEASGEVLIAFSNSSNLKLDSLGPRWILLHAPFIYLLLFLCTNWFENNNSKTKNY